MKIADHLSSDRLDGKNDADQKKIVRLIDRLFLSTKYKNSFVKKMQRLFFVFKFYLPCKVKYKFVNVCSVEIKEDRGIPLKEGG